MWKTQHTISWIISSYFSSMAVLNFSTLSSRRSWAACLPLLLSFKTVCLQSSLAEGRFIGSGSSINCISNRQKCSSTFMLIKCTILPTYIARSIVINSQNNKIICWDNREDLKEASKGRWWLLRQPGQVPLPKSVPFITVLRQRRSPSCQQHCEAQGEDVCFGEMAVILRSKETAQMLETSLIR